MPSKQPRIAVHAGPTLNNLTPVSVNSTTPQHISSPDFEGLLSVRIVDYLGPNDEQNHSPSTPLRDGATWSIAFVGRWKSEKPADDVMFGNCWKQPIRDYLPYGTSAALKFVHFVDPALSHDIWSDEPWALSPLVATMNYVDVTKIDDGSSTSPLPQDWSPHQIEEDVVPLFNNLTTPPPLPLEVQGLKGDVSKRKKWMNDANKRKEISIPSNVLVACEFYNGYIDFNTLSVKLPIGLSFGLESHWDGQPVTFVCRNKSGSESYFFVTFTIVRDEPDSSSKEKKTETTAAATTEGEDKDDLGVD